MRTHNKTRYSLDKAKGFEVHYSTPKRGLATVRFRSNVSGCRINISIVCPEPEKPKGSLDLPIGEFDDIMQAASNLVEILMERAFGKDAIG